MIDPDEFDGKTSEFDEIDIGIYDLVFDHIRLLRVIERFLDDTERQWCSIDGRSSEIFYDIFYGSDMIQVSMSDQDSSDFALVFLEIGDIRDDIICSQFFCSSKFHSGIDDDDIALMLDEHALSYLLQTDEIADLYRHFILLDEFLEVFDSGRR